MQIFCPHCGQEIALKVNKAGGYHPVCPDCQKRFVIIVALVEGHRLILQGPALDALAPVKIPRAVLEPTPDELDEPLTASADATVPEETLAEDPAPASRGGRESRPADGAADATAAEGAAAPRSGAAASSSGDGDAEESPTAGAGGGPRRERSAPKSRALSGRVDGYEVIEQLGQGGMGTVYRARQLSLDRTVALKTLHPKWAESADFLSRFTREAYAAAQLTHHNVVQIYDLGEEERIHYFSMEHVPGCTLGDLIKEKGALDPEEAAGYILQAARGLKFAHDHNMIHRDVKPANLLLNDQGVVKVADLGLVKRGTEAGAPTGRKAEDGGDGGATRPGAMGTPAYMAPEQGRDAGRVDHRVDIYSLGCTFYALTTGRPLFEGKTAAEVMTKHATEQVIPPESIKKRVPRSVSAIILKMVAKDPDERYGSMEEVIRALEDFLGIAAGPFTPREEHARSLEDAVDAFNTCSGARIGAALKIGYAALCGMVALAGIYLGRPLVFNAAVSLWLFTAASYVVLTGITQRSHLFRKLRQLVLGARLPEWVGWGLLIAALLALVVALGLHWVMLATLAVGAGLAAVFHVTVDAVTARQRRPHVEAVREMLKQMRLRGLEEDALRRFVCKYAGRNWEPFYEALFGYEAKIAAREHWGPDEDGRPRKKHAAWRDGIIRGVEAKQERREAARQRKHLARIEAQRLKAAGATEEEAERSADERAERMVERAAEYRETGEWAGMEAGAEEAEELTPPRRRSGLVANGLALVLGPPARLAVGAILLAGYALWAREQGLLAHLRERSGLGGLRWLLSAEELAPLSLPVVPDAATAFVSHHGAGIAGIALLASVFHPGKRMTVCLLPGVALLIAAPVLPVPEVVPGLTPAETRLAAGAALGAAGYWLGRS